MNRNEGEILVLRDHIDHEEFTRVATGQGWIKYKTYEGDGEKESSQEIWTTPEKDSAIHYIDDPLTLTKTVWIRGAKLKELLFEVCRRLPSYDPEEMIELAVEAESHDDAVNAVLRIAAGFPKFDPDALYIFEQYLTSPSPLLRKATLQAIGYNLWLESIPLLEKVVAEDSDSEVREFAQTILNYAREQQV